MKKSRLCLFIMLILAASCTKSPFSTTTRHNKNGKVTYTNHYARERIKPNKIKTQRPATLTKDSSANSAGTMEVNPGNIGKMTFKASSDMSFAILNNPENLYGQYTLVPDPVFQNEKELTRSNHPGQPLKKDREKVQIRKNTIAGSTSLKKTGNDKEKGEELMMKGSPKTEKLGLAGFILSFLGVIPLIGIPFGILAIIFGAKSLKKIKRNPEKFKGKGFATASIVIGCAMLVFNIVIIASSIKTSETSPAPTQSGSRGDCNFV